MGQNKIDPEKLRKAQEARRIIDLQAFELELMFMSSPKLQKARQDALNKSLGKGGPF